MLNELLAAEGLTDESDVEHIHLLVGDWQLLADLSFADLVLWVPSLSGAYTVVAHARSTTGATLFNRDLIGARATGMEKELLDEASDTRTYVTQVETARDLGVSAGSADVGILAEAVPIVRNGEAIALVVRYSEEVRRRGSSRLEKYYRETAMALMRMIVQGTFPDRAAPSGARHGEPRVGDGIFILDRDSHVQYASPNAVSLMHRLGHGGEIEGSYLAEVVSSLGAELRQVDETLPLVLTGRAPWRTELEVGRTSISLRAIPLTDEGERVGAIVLARDVSEIPAPQTRAAVAGRNDQGDAPPGEEQLADRVGSAASADPPDRQSRGQERTDRSDAASLDHHRRPRRAQSGCRIRSRLR